MANGRQNDNKLSVHNDGIFWPLILADGQSLGNDCISEFPSCEHIFHDVHTGKFTFAYSNSRYGTPTYSSTISTSGGNMASGRHNFYSRHGSDMITCMKSQIFTKTIVLIYIYIGPYTV